MHEPVMSVRLGRAVLLCVLSTLLIGEVFAQQPAQLEGSALYDALKKFELQGKASVTNLSLKRDRGIMTFTGDFYFAAPVNGRVTGAVFIGNGTFHADTPPTAFEKEIVKRMVKADAVDSDFRVAVLRFTDNTFDIIGKGQDTGAAVPAEATKLAKELEQRLLKETGINLSSRLLISLANNESPGFFFAQFDGGSRKRFTLIVDLQSRIPGSAFRINGGEKVLIFCYNNDAFENDIWVATYSEDDYKSNQASYADKFDVVSPLNYNMNIDLREARRMLHTEMRIDFESAIDHLNIIPLMINENLTEWDNIRLKHAMRLKSAKFAGADLPFIQEDWEAGLALLLPKIMNKGEKFSVELKLDGDFINSQLNFLDGYYPMSNECWYPRHGYLKRSTFDLTFRHHKQHQVASMGKLIREEDWPDGKGDRLTEFKMDSPISFATFAAGGIKRYSAVRKLQFGEMSIDFYSLPPLVARINENFILNELGNSIDYFSTNFGPYPYKDFHATFHPFNFGQGFPTLLLIPIADEANRDVYSFIAHETSHQWWGNLVAWRSYRDQWLSEGFAEYSGMLYTLERTKRNQKNLRDMIKESREKLYKPPETLAGIGQGRVADIGPLILGLRLDSRNSRNAYQALTYDKGALVLRMLHFLFTDPSSGNGQPFFDMMADFVKRYTNKAASTEEFIDVANEHFIKTTVAKQFGLKNLDWFFRQWVYEAKLPNYRMEYNVVTDASGKFVFKGIVKQENAGQDWFMPLPVTLKFPGGQAAHALVYANGPQAPFQMALPMEPDSIELDPDIWILTEKTSTKKQ